MLGDGILLPADAGYALYLENDLEFGIMDRDNMMLLDSLTLLPFYESDDKSESDSKQNTILQKLSDGIAAVIAKIREIISGAMRAISNLGKEKLTYDDYKNSSTGNAEMKKRTEQIKKEVDDAFLEARPVISLISKVTHINAKKVEEVCDKVNRRLENVDWAQKAMDGVVQMISCNRHMYKKHGDEVEMAMEVLDAKREEIRTAKMGYVEQTNAYKALNQVSNMYSRLSNKLFGPIRSAHAANVQRKAETAASNKAAADSVKYAYKHGKK